MITRFVSSLLALVLLAPALQAQQFSFGGEERLTAEIIPESNTITPGRPFTVAVKMKHAEHKHSYWKHPGAPGFGTTFKWTLPEGFKAGEPQWPTPIKGKAAGFVGYLYEGEIYPLVTITPSATIKSGDPVPLAVAINALVCDESSCLPSKPSAKASLTVSEAAGPPDAATKTFFEKARKALPAAPKSWTFKAYQNGKDYGIVLHPEAGANLKMSKVFFFSSALAAPDKDIDPEKPQELAQAGSDWVLTLPPDAENPPKDALIGVIKADEGWLEGNPDSQGFEVNLPLTEGKPPAATSTNSASTGAPAAKGPITNGFGTGTLLFFAFVGGMILNIMPCVFPVIGIKILGFVQQAGHDRKKIFLHGLAYTAGVLVCFWALALFVIVLGKGWGAQLQSPLFVLCLCYFFMAFGLNMAGVFEIGTSAIGVGQELQSQSGLKGSFFSGLLATVVATPCSAPFLAPALTWAISLPAVLALLVFTVIGLGLSSPYLILSVSPGLVKLLPRPGAWMESFKQAMSFLLFGTAGYMLWVLGGMVNDAHLLQVLFGLVLIAMACWIYGRWYLPHKPAGTQRTALLLSVVVLVGGLLLGWPPNAEGELKWQEWSPETVQKLRSEGTPVYIDFTARWCATCQVNHHVYNSEALKAAFRKHKVVLLKADYTNYDERITETLRREYHTEAIPVNVLYIPGAKEHYLLPNLLTVANVSEALEKLEKK
ncbi:MAG: putative thiol:disulfide interchange protein DsbD [Verrucomicrobiaceae bacterium]|nr:putative thiol:disulfide interchange protein DsbD [Verrucomicrobiaceae bacterium]